MLQKTTAFRHKYKNSKWYEEIIKTRRLRLFPKNLEGPIENCYNFCICSLLLGYFKLINRVYQWNKKGFNGKNVILYIQYFLFSKWYLFHLLLGVPLVLVHLLVVLVYHPLGSRRRGRRLPRLKIQHQIVD